MDDEEMEIAYRAHAEAAIEAAHYARIERDHHAQIKAERDARCAVENCPAVLGAPGDRSGFCATCATEIEAMEVRDGQQR